MRRKGESADALYLQMHHVHVLPKIGGLLPTTGAFQSHLRVGRDELGEVGAEDGAEIVGR